MAEHISKSEKKRQARDVERIARELAQLSMADIGRLPASEELRGKFAQAARLKGGALKRHIKYLAKELRGQSLDSFLQFLDEKKGLKLKEAKEFQELTRLRDGIINDVFIFLESMDGEALMDPQKYPSPHLEEAKMRLRDLDEEEVRISAHRYMTSRKPVHRREVFRLLKAALSREKIQLFPR